MGLAGLPCVVAWGRVNVGPVAAGNVERESGRWRIQPHSSPLPHSLSAKRTNERPNQPAAAEAGTKAKAKYPTRTARLCCAFAFAFRLCPQVQPPTPNRHTITVLRATTTPYPSSPCPSCSCRPRKPGAGSRTGSRGWTRSSMSPRCLCGRR